MRAPWFRIDRLGVVLAAALLAIGASPRRAEAQAPQTFYACYVPAVGALYMIKLPGLPSACLSAAHQQVTWREGATGPATGDLTGSYPAPTVAGLRGKPLSATAPVAGQVLTFDGTTWVPSAPSSGSAGAAGGDLTGAYPNPSVAKIRGSAVNAATPSIGQALVFDGTAWTPTTIITGSGGVASGDLSGSYPAPTLAKIQGRTVTAPAPAAGQVLTFDGTAWVPAAPISGSSGTAGGDLGGTYPNPTVAKLKGIAMASQAPTLGQALVFDGTNWTPTTIITGSSGAAGGDLSGTYPDPTVAKLQGRAVASTAPTAGQVLTFNGSAWTPTTATVSGSASGDLSGSFPSPTVAGIQGKPIASTAPTTGQVLTFNGASWSPSAAPGATGTAGGDLSGSYPNPSVIQLRGTGVSATAPTTGQVLTFNGTAWAPAATKLPTVIDVSQPFSVPPQTSTTFTMTCPTGVALSVGWLNYSSAILTRSERSADGVSWSFEWANGTLLALSGMIAHLYCAQ